MLSSSAVVDGALTGLAAAGGLVDGPLADAETAPLGTDSMEVAAAKHRFGTQGARRADTVNFAVASRGEAIMRPIVFGTLPWTNMAETSQNQQEI